MPNNPISPIGLISLIGHITKDIYLITVSLGSFAFISFIMWDVLSWWEDLWKEFNGNEYKSCSRTAIMQWRYRFFFVILDLHGLESLLFCIYCRLTWKVHWLMITLTWLKIKYFFEFSHHNSFFFLLACLSITLRLFEIICKRDS